MEEKIAEEHAHSHGIHSVCANGGGEGHKDGRQSKAEGQEGAYTL